VKIGVTVTVKELEVSKQTFTNIQNTVNNTLGNTLLVSCYTVTIRLWFITKWTYEFTTN